MCSTRTSVVGNGPGIILLELAMYDTSFPRKEPISKSSKSPSPSREESCHALVLLSCSNVTL